MKRPYDSTVARIAGNIASGMVGRGNYSTTEGLVIDAVRMARAIVAETIKTEPADVQHKSHCPAHPDNAMCICRDVDSP